MSDRWSSLVQETILEEQYLGKGLGSVSRVFRQLIDAFLFQRVDPEVLLAHGYEAPRLTKVRYFPPVAVDPDQIILYFLETNLTGRADIWCAVNRFLPASRTCHPRGGSKKLPFGMSTFQDRDHMLLAIDSVVKASFEEYDRQVEVAKVAHQMNYGLCLPHDEMHEFLRFIRNLERNTGLADYHKMSAKDARMWVGEFEKYFGGAKAVGNWSDETSDGLFL